MVPFAALKVAVNTDSKEREIRDMLSVFAKAITGRSTYKVMQDYDKLMSELPSTNPAEALMSCIKDNKFNGELYVINESISILQLFKADFNKCSTLQKIMRCFANSASRGESAGVLFKVKHLGLYIAYNVQIPSTPVPRIVLPSVAKNMASIQFMPIKNFEKEFFNNFIEK